MGLCPSVGLGGGGICVHPWFRPTQRAPYNAKKPSGFPEGLSVSPKARACARGKNLGRLNGL